MQVSYYVLHLNYTDPVIYLIKEMGKRVFRKP